jgi:hypothetical protein
VKTHYSSASLNSEPASFSSGWRDATPIITSRNTASKPFAERIGWSAGTRFSGVISLKVL